MKLTEISTKDVIDDFTGVKLGKITDLEINSETSEIEYVIIQKGFKISNLFSNKESLSIPWNKILKIGSDVIIVEGEKIKKDKSVENKIK